MLIYHAGRAAYWEDDHVGGLGDRHDQLERRVRDLREHQPRERAAGDRQPVDLGPRDPQAAVLGRTQAARLEQQTTDREAVPVRHVAVAERRGKPRRCPRLPKRMSSRRAGTRRRRSARRPAKPPIDRRRSWPLPNVDPLGLTAGRRGAGGERVQVLVRDVADGQVFWRGLIVADDDAAAGDLLVDAAHVAARGTSHST